ncbi:hypothetical protein LP7551_05317 [Roseibium album]|nr:hypothetical protein LP7551_05317 [Roseibium album]
MHLSGLAGKKTGMRRLSQFIVVLILIAPLPELKAQEAVVEPHEISESGQEYLRALRLRRINTDVTYYSPLAPPPKLDTKQQLEERQDQSTSQGQGLNLNARWTVGLFAGALLLLIAFIFLRFGGGLAVSLKRDAQNPGRERAIKKGQAPVWAEKLGSLDEILRMQDRRHALVLLAQKALATTVAANGVLMQKSWTARDALRHIPDKQSHLEALRSLVLSSERVQFGGRDVTEDEFRNHVAGCRQLLGSGVS